ncbi:formate dehydrogenase subunit delta [Aestuariivirga sp.]|jgi:formate dehydrogenase subunit delta|uniref:formate dehydrogenase subunit delta n=1 Tax=Aestuariivirga sp. TaxID=2650926 RepID=UPI003784BFB1
MEQRDLIRMANQIATFFHGSGPEAEARDVAEHINKFWEPHMRNALFAYLDAGGKELDPAILKAAALIKRPKPAAA